MKRFLGAITILGYLTLLATASAFAIERYRILPLADLGLGSRVLGFIPTTASDTGEFVGSIRGSDGSAQAAMWDQGDFNADTFTLIAGGDGQHRMALAGAADGDGLRWVVGVKRYMANDPSGEVPMLWRQTEPDGIFTEVALSDVSFPLIGTASSRANDVALLDDGRLLVVGSVTPPDGRSRPVVWEETTAGSFEMSLLNGISGPGGEASTVPFIREVVPDGVVIIGHSTSPKGRKRATAWLQGELSQWMATDLGALRNAGSAVYGAAPLIADFDLDGDVDGDDFLFRFFAAVGDSIASNGRRWGTLWVRDQGGNPKRFPAAPPAGFANSSVRAIQPGVQRLGGHDQWAIRAAGAAWNDLAGTQFGNPGNAFSDLTAVVFAPRLIGLGIVETARYYGIRLAAIQEDVDWHPVALTAVGGGGELAGVGHATDDETLRAFVALPTDVLLVDAVVAPIGRVMANQKPTGQAAAAGFEDKLGEEEIHTRLHRADGVSLRIAARRTKGQRQVVMDTSALPYRPASTGNDQIQITVVLNGVNKNETITVGSWKVQALGILEPDDQWVVIAEHSIGAAAETWVLPRIGTEFIDPLNGAIRLRLRVTAEQGRRPWGVDIDEITMRR